MALLLDTGPILALLDRDDPHHHACVALVEASNEDLVVPSLVLVEVNYWVRKMLDLHSWLTFVEDVSAGAYRLVEASVDDLVRAAEIERDNEDLRLGLVDATVMALCERMGEDKVATLDRRHFAAVRPRHCDSLRLLPD